jgi:hypothetical protein
MEKPIQFISFTKENGLELTTEAIILLQAQQGKKMESMAFVSNDVVNDAEIISSVINGMFKVELNFQLIDKPGVWVFCFDKDDEGTELALVFVLRKIKLRGAHL